MEEKKKPTKKLKMLVIILAILILVGFLFWGYLLLSSSNPVIQKIDNSKKEEQISTNKTDKSEYTVKEPTQSDIEKAEASIRTFMNKPELELIYLSSNKHPTNFTVAIPDKANSLATGQGMYITPPEWNRPIYTFQQKEYINERCEVYEYEVRAKTSQIIEIHLVYPTEIQTALSGPNGLSAAKCDQYGMMEIPLKTKDMIEKTAFEYLSRDPEHTKFLLRSDIQPEYTPTMKGVEYPAANEWKWEDKSYKLPEGLISDPYPYPTIRIIMSSGDKLISYFNSSDLF